MPELPEVETVVRELRPLLVGRRITALEVGPHRLRRHWSPDWEAALVGKEITALRRRGKWILMDLQGGQHLVIHLGMTGQLRVLAADQERATHTHLVVHLDQDKQQLRFRDIRRFGSATLFASAAELERFFQETKLGAEPFALDAKSWCAHLARTRRCLKAVLLDQRVVAGVGNIYADETLFEARLHPARLAVDLTRLEAERLRRAIPRVLNRAIERRGSSIRDYVGGSGLQGEYQKEFRAYGRTSEPCSRCKTSIERIRLAGRSTHFCPRCQPITINRE